MVLPPSPVNASTRQPYALETLARLPLAESFYALWGHFASDSVLDDLFERHRGRSYHDMLSFAELVAVLGDALLRCHGSGRQAISQAIGRRQLPTRQRAVYAKLSRLPLPLAEAFLSTLTARLRPLFPAALFRAALPVSLAGLSVVVLDGKKIKRAAKRLLATRGRPGKLFGGKLLVAYTPAEGLAVAMAADPDGEANDCKLMPRVLPLARAAVAGERLWVADRQFCDLDQTTRFREQGDHFLVRFSLRLGFQADGARPAQTGQDSQGRAFTQEWGPMGSAKDPRRRYVRRITLRRPGAEAVILVTDLVDEGKYPAEDLLAAYLMRWQIEAMFQQITEVFELRHLIGTAPAATIFQASLCLVVYNVLQLVRGYIAQARPGPTKAEDLSAEMIFRDLHEELVSLHKTLTAEELPGALRQARSIEEVRECLRERLGTVWSRLWIKTRNKKRRPQTTKARQSGAHTSVHKLLQQAKQHTQATDKVSRPSRQ